MYHVEFSKWARFHGNPSQSNESMGLQTCQFLREKKKNWPSLTSYTFMSLQPILMKPRIFIEFGIINRAVRLIFYLNEKRGKSVTSVNMSIMDNLQGIEKNYT